MFKFNLQFTKKITPVFGGNLAKEVIRVKKILAFAAALLFVLSVVLGCGSKPQGPAKAPAQAGQTTQASQSKGTTVTTKEGTKVTVVKGKAYTDKDHVAAYIHVFKGLPPNYITKDQARKLGWKSKGTLDKVAPGKSIGGDRFGNYEKVLPNKSGRTWKECDIGYVKGNRNEKRICFSNDGLVYYSGSHYRDFVQLF